MTTTPYGQVPEALRLANEFKLCNEYDSIPSITDIAKAEAELRRLHACYQELEAQVIRDCMSTQQGAADGFFLLLPQRPKPEAPAGTAGLGWDAYSGAQMLAFGRDCSDAAIAALRTQQAGWRLVPIEPTQAMLDAMQSGGWMVGNYRDMLAAAPQQEAQEPAAVVVPCHTPSGKRVALYSAKQDLPIGTKLYTGPQPSPTAQAAESVLEDAARWQELREQHEDDTAERCCVFAPNDMRECLVPVGSLPGELDAFMDSERAARKQGGA